MKDKKEPIVFFEDYEKISDLLMWFTREVTLKFNVTLAKPDKDGNRVHYHKEWEYNSRYLNKEKVLSIKRSFGYYISIDVNRNIDDSIMIRQSDMVMLKLKLKKIIKWFTTLFKDEDGKLVLIGDYEPVEMYIGEYKTIRFDPIVFSNEVGTEFKEGVRITLNNGYYFDINIDTFFEFYYIIDTFNMYQAAASLVNYLPATFGNFTNVSEFSSASYNGYNSGGKNFFDK